VSVTQGKRRDVDLHKMEPGDYGKSPTSHEWICCAPNGYHGALGRHDVIEHEDGTLTVSPSILIMRAAGDQWHGFLERGVWREA
jgi:hypothetical protein